MTSREAGALIASGGKTTDVEQANLMAEGKLLDPEALERAYYRRALGFDFSCEIDPANHAAYARDDELNLSVKIVWTDDDERNSERLAKACMKLKSLHDKQLAIPEGEVV